MRRVVITGLGALTPIGAGIPAYLQALKEGKSGANRITHFDPTHFKTQFACELKGFDPADYMDRKEYRRIDPFVQYALAVSKEAVEDSGLDLEKIDLDRAGVIWGSGIGGFETIENDITEAASFGDTPRYSPFLIPKLIADIAPGHISIKYGFRGINYATVSACASSSHAMINALDYIRWNKADIFITGGSEAAVTRAGIGGFSSMKALSTRNDDPQTASRPFDMGRDGFVLGEGAGALIFEEYEHAKARGAKIYAEVIGGGMTADAYHITAPHPEGLGASNVMKLAIQDAGITPEDVDYINVHGTSTPLGDIAEIKAIQSVFGESAYNLNISSTKSMTGHLLGAAGAIEAIACIGAIRDGVIPPTINNEHRDEAIDEKLNLTLNTAQDRDVNIAVSNTFGFGGHNTSVIFRKI
jgi:3-oxoacyl-[acyl-carrier-protein] synthase II